MHPTTTRRIVIAALIVPWLWFFGRALITPEGFIYRDAAHYYYPLHQWITDAIQAGDMPFWNPQENLGAPLAADSTAGLFYPGRLIFFLPLPYIACYKLYITLHTLLAAILAYRLARHYSAEPPAAAIAAISYAYGGFVLFQYCNVIYQVGAAWLPLAILAGDKLFFRKELKWCLLLAICLAMMVLGGDPQIAYNTLLVLALLAIPKLVHRQTDDSGEAIRPWQSLGWLGLAALLAAGLAAVQIIPSMQWAKATDRYAFKQPRNIYEIPATLQRKELAKPWQTVSDGLLKVEKEGHEATVYNFSIAPWHYGELIWPNLYGKPYPINRRWGRAIPGEGRVWVPSLYLGLVPILLAISSWIRGGQEIQDRWLRLTLVLSCLAALGWYGIGWIMHELAYLIYGNLRTAPPDQPIGGIYWLMTSLLPAYAYFRYPAKLFVIANLAISMLAARQWKQVTLLPNRKLIYVTGLVGVSSVLLAALATSSFWWPADWLPTVRASMLFGPFDRQGATRELLLTFLHTAVVSGVVIYGLRRHWRNPIASFGYLAVALVVIDLCLANGWMIPTAPHDNWLAGSYSANTIVADQPDNWRPVRVHRGLPTGWNPRTWSETQSTSRQVSGLRWDIDTLHPKYNLLPGPPRRISLLETFGSAANNDLKNLMYVGRTHGFRRRDRLPEPSTDLLGMLGAQYLLLPAGTESIPGATKLAAGLAAPDNLDIWQLDTRPQRGWIVHQVRQVQSPDRRNPDAFQLFIQRQLFPNDQLIDWQTVAVVESTETEPFQTVSRPTLNSLESCELKKYSNHEVRFDVVLEAPGLVVTNDLYHPNWRAYLVDDDGEKEIPVHRTNVLLRGVVLPAGNHQLVYRYVPIDVYQGATISFVGWLLVAIGGWWLTRKR